MSDETVTRAELEENGWLLEFVPPEERTYALCKVAAGNARKRVKHNQSILCVIPEKLRTPELCLLAVKNNGDALRDVPMELRSRDLCLEAVKRHGEGLTYVPKELRDREICEAAVNEYGRALMYVPKKWITEKMAYTAISTAPLVLSSVPEEMKTLDLCIYAALRDYKASSYMSDEMIGRVFDGL